MEESRELFDLPLIEELADSGDLVSREPLLDEIEAALAEPDCRIVLVRGHPGSGKTTLMAGLASRHPDWPRYFIQRAGQGDGIRSHDGSLASFLTVIGLQLAASRPDLFPDSSHELNLDADVVARHVAPGARVEALRVERMLLHPFRSFAARVRLSVDILQGQAIGLSIREIGDAALVSPGALEIPALIEPLEILRQSHPGGRIVVLVDGLDELRVRDAPVNVGEWLAEHPRLHPNLRFVVASRDDSERLDTLRQAHEDCLREVDASKNAESAVQQYAANVSAKAHVARILQAHSRRPEWFAHRAALKAAGIFQYVAFLDRALAAVAAEGPGAPALDWLWSGDEADWPNGVGGLYAAFMLRIKDQVQKLTATRDAWDQVYRPLLGLLLVAHAPLTAAQLTAFGGIVPASTAAAGESCETALLRLGQFLKGDPASGYLFFHNSVADYVASPSARASLRSDEDASHQQITEYALSRHGQAGNWKAADPYLRTFLAPHAAAARRLDDLLEDPRYLAAADPPELLATLGNARQAAAIATLYRRAAPDFRANDEPAALAHLELYAREAGEHDFAARVAAMPGQRPWATAWTNRGPLPIRGVIGRHEAGIATIAAAWDDHGQPLVLTGGNDGQIGVWDPRKGTLVRPPLAPAGESSGAVTALAVGQLRTGQAFVVSGAWDGTVRAWNMPARRSLCAPLAGAENAGSARAVGAIEDGSTTGVLAAVCETSGGIRPWNLETGTPLGPPIPVGDLALAAIGTAAGRVLIAAASVAGAFCQVRVWDAVTGQPAGPALQTEEQPFEALAIGELSGAAIVAVADTALGVQLFDPETGAARSKRRVCWDDGIKALAIGVLGSRTVLAAGGDAGLIRGWDLATWRPLGETVTAHQHGRLTALMIRPGVLLSAGIDRVTVDTPLSGAENIRHTTAEPAVQQWAYSEKNGLHHPVTVARPSQEVTSLASSRAGNSPIACCDGHRVRLLDGATGAATGKPMFGSCERVRAVAAGTLDDGTAVAVVGVDETIRVWDVERGSELYPPLAAPPGHGSTCAGLAVIRLDGRPVLVVGTWRSGARIWDLATGEPAGAREIAGPEYVGAMTAGDINGRPVAVFCTASGITVCDLKTGDASYQFTLADFTDPSVAQLFADGGQAALALGAVIRGTITVCHFGASPSSAPAQRTITVPDELGTLAVTQLDGRPVAVCGGREGNLQIIDLSGDGGDAQPAAPVLSTVVATLTSGPAVVCACEDQVRVLDLATGRPVVPPPPTFRMDNWSKIATAEIAGRSVAICAAGREIHVWYLDTGEPAVPQPVRCEERVECLAIGLLNGRNIIISGHFDRSIHIFNLETGQPACEKISSTLRRHSGLGLIEYADLPLLVFDQYGIVRSRFIGLDHPPVNIEELLARPPDPPALEETPPAPPRVGNKVKLSRNRNVDGHAMALGTMGGVPVVLSGHDDGQIDVFTIGTALPVGPPLMGHDSEVTALAFAEFDSRPIAASGGRDGTVRLWDLADASSITTIRAAAEVRSLALHPPGYCVIGTQRGVLAVQFGLPPAAASASSRIPVDIRAARACPDHQHHVADIETGGIKVVRICIKGLQTGNPAHKPLEYAQGHCHVFPDRLVLIQRSLSDEQAGQLVIPLNTIYFESQDVPHAYEYDGGHFRLTIETPQTHRSLCFYRRSERDLLARLVAPRRRYRV